MSRIGQQPIDIKQGVTAEIKDGQITIKASKGELSQPIPKGIKAEIKDNQILVTRKSDSKEHKSLHGLVRSLIFNMIEGVTDGFQKVLELEGTGYRVNQTGDTIELSLGFSHPVTFKAPEGIKLEVKDQKVITVSGQSKQLVGQTAAKIRDFRKPDSYKGKGVRYQGEVVKLKPGKAAKGAEE
ncbi:50S ribosomal protein L6 [Patescibacteria group bacterium]